MITWLYAIITMITFLCYKFGKIGISKNGEELNDFRTYMIFSLIFPVTWTIVLMNLFRREE